MAEPSPEEHRPLAERVGTALRTAGSRGRAAVVRPGGLSDQAQGRFRRWLRKIWDLRGGGLYALGFAVSFLYLEISELFLEDIPAFLGLSSYTPGPLIAFAIDFMIDTLINTLYAFLWPLFVIQWSPPLGPIALLVAFLLFPRYLKPSVEQWLFHDEPDRSQADPQATASRVGNGSAKRP